MTDIPQMMADYEPAAETIDLVCDRLADLDVAAGPDTARDLVRAILAAEAPRLDERLREALETSLQTIRTAAQSALAILASTPPQPERSHPAHTQKQAAAAPPTKSAPAPPPPPPAHAESTRPIARRRPDDRPRDDAGDPVHRPVFKRPRGR